MKARIGMFDQLLEQLRNPGENGIPETIYDDLSASYTEMSSTSGAKVAEHEATIAQLSAELSAAKAHNYDLLMQSAPAPAAAEESPEENSEDDGDDSDSIGDDDDFFEKKDD